MNAYTRTYAVVKTRLEAIEDQFTHFLEYGGVSEQKVEKVVAGVRERWIEAVGMFVTDSTDLRVAEVELHVDWTRHGQLTLVQPTIDIDQSGWTGTQSPEVKLAGRRFAKLARELRRDVRFWVQFTDEIHRDQPRYRRLCAQVGVVPGGSVPSWKSAPIDRHDPLLDLPEASISIRRASSG